MDKKAIESFETIEIKEISTFTEGLLQVALFVAEIF